MATYNEDSICEVCREEMEKIGIKKGDICIYENGFYEIVFATGYWVNLQPLPRVMTTTDKIKILRRTNV